MVPERWNVTDRIFSHFGPFFALLHHPPPPPNNPENQNFEKMKKALETCILEVCNHIMYAS